MRKLSLLALGACVALALSGCGSMASLGSEEDVVASAAQSCQKLDAQNRITTRYDSRMRVIREGLPLQVSGQMLNFRVYETKDMNAFAMPNGCVRVYSALLDRLNNNEVRAVLGHEIGHVALRHSVQQYRTNNGVAIAISAGSALSSLLTGGDSSFGDMLGKATYAAVSAQYSQKLETEADDYSVDMLLKEKDGRNKALAMASALRKITTEGQGSSLMQRMFSDHPDTAERIQNVEERVRRATGR